MTPPREIGLPSREFYNDTKVVEDYTGVVSSLLISFKPRNFEGNERISSSKLAKDVVLFEQKLANATPDTQAQRDVTQYYNPRTLAETKSLIPEVSFEKVVSSLAPKNFYTDRFIIGSPSYLKELSAIVKDTPREVIQAFFQLKVIQQHYRIIEDDKITPLRQFNNRLAGVDPQAIRDRWSECICDLDSGIGWILSRFYVLESFPESSKELGDQIISDIKEQFVYALDGTKWMSAEVRQLGKQKVTNIVQKVGYPTLSPNLMSGEDVKKYYEDLSITNDTFFENSIAMAKFELRREWSQLGKPTNRDRWHMTATTANAYYNFLGNEIVFPAGIMQPPAFYGLNAPLYLTYGAFGAISGHELSHGMYTTSSWLFHIRAGNDG